MKLTIYTDLPKVEKTITLKLEHSMYGISLAAVDEEGETIPGGIILDITPRGRITFRTYVNPVLGFDRDDEGRVKHN